MKQKLAFILIISTVFVGSCRRTTTPTKAFNELVYKQQLESWQSVRLASLTKEDGWLTLATTPPVPCHHRRIVCRFASKQVRRNTPVQCIDLLVSLTSAVE